MQNLKTSEISPYLGLEIDGLDLSTNPSSETYESLINKLHQYHLLVIRNQHLNEKQLINVSQFFGKPSPSLVPTFRLADYPFISKFSNVKGEKGEALGATAPEYVFHSDSYFAPNPNKATLLYSIKSPEYGGETHFVNMCKAYETLEDSVKNLIRDKKASYKNVYVNQPPVSHPLVRVHPATGNKALFVNIHRLLGVDEMELDEAQKLVEKLYNHSIKPETIYKHQWKDGDLLIWDNRTTMHCATTIDSTQERLLHRILTEGDLPVS